MVSDARCFFFKLIIMVSQVVNHLVARLKNKYGPMFCQIITLTMNRAKIVTWPTTSFSQQAQLHADVDKESVGG